MALPQAGYAYRLKNKQTGRYLTSSGFMPDSYVTTWGPESGGNGRLSQTWHLLGLGNEKYILAQKLGGRVPTLNDYRAPSTVPPRGFDMTNPLFRPDSTRLNLEVPYDGTDGHIINSQTFYVRASGDCVTLASCNGGSLLADWGDKLGAIVGSDVGDLQRWSLEQEASYPRIATGIGPTTNSPVPPPALTGYARPNPDTTSPTTIGTTLLPSALVKDPALTRQQQAQTSPWYVVERQGFYKVVYYYESSGAAETTQSQSVTVGLTTANSTEIENTTSISVTAEASYGFKGFGASLSTTYSHQLRTLVASSTTQTSERNTTISRTFKQGTRAALAIWYRADRYALKRMDGTVILEWETASQDDVAERAYTGS
ncbi:hypothetical protein [Streptomyces sp. NPDC002490]|uniref:hypothetical protein n=1 Tax=Streptomyces sp. NPDC002490 TaxID=3154416 RepID=UPI00331EE246